MSLEVRSSQIEWPHVLGGRGCPGGSRHYALFGSPARYGRSTCTASPADSVLVVESLSEDCVWTDGIVSWYWDLVVWVAAKACDTLNNGCGQRSRSFGLDYMVLEIVNLGGVEVGATVRTRGIA
jgi:hypothetical protein